MMEYFQLLATCNFAYIYFKKTARHNEKFAIPVILFQWPVFAYCNSPNYPRHCYNKATFSNPLPVQFGDPYVLYPGYVLHVWHGRSRQRVCRLFIKDLVNWKAEGQVYFHDNKNGWSDPNAGWDGAYWAPEVYEVKGKFYLFYSAQWKENPTKEVENFRIGVAVADKPTGPFIDMTNKPIFDPGYPIIDANVFFDTDGKSYLYYSRACYKHPVESEVADMARKKGWFKEIEESWVYGIELKA